MLKVALNTINLFCFYLAFVALHPGCEIIPGILLNIIDLYFSDFILVYEEELESKSGNSELVKVSKWRQKFIKNLRKIGLEMEEVLL